MKKTYLSILLALFSFQLIAQSSYLESEKDINEHSDKVVKYFKQGEITKCFEILRLYWPLPENELNSFEQNTIKQLNIVNDRYGEAIDYLEVKHETISDFAIRKTWLVRYERNAIRITIIYYKTKEGWMLNAFKWDDSFEEEFKETKAE